MNMSDTMCPIIAAVMVIMGFVGGCDRARLKFLEEECDRYHRQILKLEKEIREHDIRLKEVEAKERDLSNMWASALHTTGSEVAK